MFVGGESAGTLTGMGRQLRRAPISPFLRQRAPGAAGVQGRGPDYERLTTLIEAGQVTPRLDRTYPLDATRDPRPGKRGWRRSGR